MKTIGIAFGLGTALCWGTADYVVATAARRLGALRVALGFHLMALIPLGALTLATGSLGHVRPRDALTFGVLGAVGWLSYLAFYRALAIGPISILSPIVSGYAAVTVILSVLFTGARLSAVETVAVVITIAGVAVACAERSVFRDATLSWRSVRGPALAVAAMFLFGGYIFGLSYHDARLGWVVPIFLARGFTALFLLAHAEAIRSARWRGLGTRDLGVIALIAGLDTLGYVFYRQGVLRAATPLVATASAPYALVAVLLGVRLLGERLTARQCVGLLAAAGGLVLLATQS